MRQYFGTIIILTSLVGSALVQQTHAQSEWADMEWEEEESFSLYGFGEFLGGKFIDGNLFDSSESANEVRLQLAGNGDLGPIYSSFKVDLLEDSRGDKTDADVRELYLAYKFGNWLDIRVGRQVLSTGTGEQVFLNDTFAKDFISLFSGREIDYLKVPTDVVRINYQHSLANVELIWTPHHEPDNFIDGKRFSYFDFSRGEIVADPIILRADEPKDDEYWLRVFKNINGYELAAYYFRGRFKQPLGFSVDKGKNIFPKMRNLGFSVRAPIGKAIGNIELSHYRSLEDKDGTDPLIANSQTRLLLGYEVDLLPKFTWSSQYYLEFIRDYDELLRFSPNPETEQAERRHVLTTKLNYQLLQDRLTLSIFTMFSTNESDYYIDANVSYRQSDALTYNFGVDIYSGDDEFTRFGMLQNNDNIYFRIRYSI